MPPRFSLSSTFIACLSFVASGCILPTGASRGAEFAAANRAAEDWVDGHRTSWTLSLSSSHQLSRPSWANPCDQNPVSGTTVLRYAAANTEIDLHLQCPLGPAATWQDLAASFSRAVLQELPHGIRSNGWTFRVMTPASAIATGVTFAEATGNRIKVTIETPLYAIIGHSTRDNCSAPADAPSPEGCYLVREHPVPLRLTLVVPFRSAALE